MITYNKNNNHQNNSVIMITYNKNSNHQNNSVIMITYDKNNNHQNNSVIMITYDKYNSCQKKNQHHLTQNPSRKSHLIDANAFVHMYQIDYFASISEKKRKFITFFTGKLHAKTV